MRSVFCSWLIFFLAPAALADHAIQVTRSDQGAVVTAHGKPFAEYLIRSGHQPVLWPIVGPTGKAVTRSYPLGPRGKSEMEDHVHHRSLWFSHGDVNGYDFWLEPPEGETTEIRHREFVKLETGKRSGTIVTRNEWVAGGKTQCEDVRTLLFGAEDHSRWIDFTIKLLATNGPVTFGDTKEGTFSVRVAGTMKVDPPGKGKIVNSRGEQDQAAWGRPAEWVDYRGPVAGDQLGIAIFSHPSNFRHPTKWHVRKYGLFAANPFGEHDFPSGKPQQGATTLAAGDVLTLRYFVLIHNEDVDENELRQVFERFSDSKVSSRVEADAVK